MRNRDVVAVTYVFTRETSCPATISVATRMYSSVFSLSPASQPVLGEEGSRLRRRSHVTVRKQLVSSLGQHRGIQHVGVVAGSAELEQQIRPLVRAVAG